MSNNSLDPNAPDESRVISYGTRGRDVTKLKVYLDPDLVKDLHRGRTVRIYSLPDGSRTMDVDDRNGCARQHIEIVPGFPPASLP